MNNRINNTVLLFHEFILNSWDYFMAFNDGLSQMELDERTNDWLQANWEILVENTILANGKYMEVYGAGADVNGDSSRISFPDKLPTNRIYCMSQNDAPILDLLSNQLKKINRDMTFFGFVGWEQDYFRVAPPFDCVLLEDDVDRIVVRISDVFFDIEAVEQPIAPASLPGPTGK